jgi:hypothetical protein
MCVKMHVLFEKPVPAADGDSIFAQIECKSAPLRLAATIPHPHCRISILSWNEKWIIEIEAGAYKQTYRISQDSVQGLEQAKKLVTPQLLSRTMERFHEMHADFDIAYKSLSSQA